MANRLLNMWPSNDGYGVDEVPNVYIRKVVLENFYNVDSQDKYLIVTVRQIWQILSQL